MTVKQMRIFWAAFGEACSSLGITQDERDGYRKQVMREETGCEHLRDVSNARGFERIMARLKADAGDYQAAGSFAIGDERRMGAMIDDCARQVFELDGHSGGHADVLAYVVGILNRSGMTQIRVNSSTWWMDFAPDKPMKVFQILDTHRRRLVRRNRPGERVAYKFGSKYV